MKIYRGSGGIAPRINLGSGELHALVALPSG